VNVVDVLFIQESIYNFKPVETTIRRRLRVKEEK
jgi:hypothetical protein